MDNNNTRGEPNKSQIPEITNNERQLRDVTADYLKALYLASPEPIFNRAGKLVIILTDSGQSRIEIITEAMMIGFLTRCADFIRIRGDREIETFPDSRTVKDILSLRKWRFQKLLGITETPVIRHDGTILTKSGYDESTMLYYCPGSLVVPAIPGKPTDAQVKRARSLILEPITDFPFSDDASRANALAVLFTPILRPLISGRDPLALFDKPQAGTGASLLAEVISVIHSGKPAQMISPPRNEDEFKKLIFSILVKGQNLCVLDNLATVLQSEALCTALTQPRYEGRLLGKTEVQTLPSLTTWICTGNNIRLGGDLPRRSILVHQNARVAEPWLREGFKHPQLIQWVSEKRGDILGAVLLLARFWVLAGKPNAPNPVNLGGFENWCHTMGGILSLIEVPGFLNNLKSGYSKLDTDGQQWAAFLDVWHETIGDESVTTKQLIELLDTNADLDACLPIARNEKKSFARMLGIALSAQLEARHPNSLMLTSAGKQHKVLLWQVVDYTKINKPPANPPSLASEGGYGGFEPAGTSSENNYAEDANQNNNSVLASALSGENNPPDPLNPPDANDEFDDEEIELTDFEALHDSLKAWELCVEDLLQENEQVLWVDGATNNPLVMKLPPDQKCKAICQRCGLTIIPPSPLGMEERLRFFCQSCGCDDIGWRFDNREEVTPATLLERIPDAINRLF
ncbi:hypothetical protein ACFLWO_01800 [Chloroflexota bacterium]